MTPLVLRDFHISTAPLLAEALAQSAEEAGTPGIIKVGSEVYSADIQKLIVQLHHAPSGEVKVGVLEGQHCFSVESIETLICALFPHTDAARAIREERGQDFSRPKDDWAKTLGPDVELSLLQRGISPPSLLLFNMLQLMPPVVRAMLHFRTVAALKQLIAQQGAVHPRRAFALAMQQAWAKVFVEGAELQMCWRDMKISQLAAKGWPDDALDKYDKSSLNIIGNQCRLAAFNLDCLEVSDWLEMLYHTLEPITG